MSAQGSITFVPSVHFSPTHRRRVRRTIREEEPDIVAVELDERRYDRIEKHGRQSPAELLRELPPATAAAYTVLRTIQRTVVRLYGLDPSQTDMEVAVETAAELNVDIALIDDPIAETVNALASRVGPELIPKLFARAQRMGPEQQAAQFELMTLPFEDVTSGEDVQPVIEQMRSLLPELTDVMIDRRDRAMAARLHALRAAGHDVVAVIGAGHHLGIQRTLDDLESRPADETVDVPIRSSSRSVTRIPID
ncbi:conjugal transfer protein TraB [Natronorubrum sp. JWXQ-INN-674]|uniref:Conjugal transfer protein TraB n=1 Tax=Natronorubrum halalkaliphilum TaxID=2691917 RepID=A0A6B0VN57_9EURY|nr:TraB/GumN family protein [Natronorubrum halalkaliphilum]MXV61999.1 conjugal transfer protein TraB [Natronorubrum halalkaliphilum]